MTTLSKMIRRLDDRLDRSKQPQDLGFTLLEKMIILAVLGILGAISAPSFQTLLNRMKLDQAVTEIRGALEETQRQAVRDNKLCNLNLNLGGGEVTGDCLITGTRSIPDVVQIATNLLPGDIDPSADVGSSVDVAQSMPNHWVNTFNSFAASDISLGWPLGSNVVGSQIALATETEETSKAVVVIHIISQAGDGDDEDGQGGQSGHWSQFIGWWCSVLDWGCSSASEEESAVESLPPIPVKYGVLGNPQFEIATHLAPPNTPTDPSGKIVLFLPDAPKVQKKCLAISNTLGLTRIGTYSGQLSPPDITDSGVCTASNWQDQ